jgi:hypothetical protein
MDAKLMVEEALRLELGRNSRFRLYDRELRTPMNFVLDEAERQLGDRVLTYWVDVGFPEVFVLSGFEQPAVTFSQRYVELTSLIRNVLVQPMDGSLQAKVGEQIILKVISELALWRGDPDFAVLAFVKATAKSSFFIPDFATLADLEASPIGEAYTATWFYGLIHELGHVTRQGQKRSIGPFTDDFILAELTDALPHFPYPEAYRAQALARTQSARRSLIGIDHMREEGLADVFAASVLYQSTMDIMKIAGGESFQVLRLWQELLLALNTIVVFDRCKRLARIASATEADAESAFDLGLSPVATQIRSRMLRWYLQQAATLFIFGDNPSDEEKIRVSEAFDAVVKHIEPSLRAVDTGLARAMEFALFPDRRENDWDLLEAFRSHAITTDRFLVLEEGKQFCDRAAALGVDGKLLRALKAGDRKPR